MTRSPIDFLWETPPYCPTPGCYVHGINDSEHHVEGCPMYDTLASQQHRMVHAINNAAEVFATEARVIVDALDRTAWGRLALTTWKIRSWFRR